MRNLKKILALVLALVMSLSLVTIANASDFTDADDITYEEAADVMSTIGVIEGYEDGSFDPDGTLVREEAAKLVTFMLLGDNANNLGIERSSFNDVAMTRWSAPAIEYCVSLGIIDGAGDGNFYPRGQLTAVAFAKVLLTALGYDADTEGLVGNTWSVNTAALAMEVGLDDGIEDLSWNAALTREEAAQMALNAICAPLVEYDGGVTVVVGDTPVSFGSGKAVYVTTTLAREQRISDEQLSNSNDYTVEFGERYFPRLRLVRETDAFERPSHTWVYENTELGTYVDYDLLVETYTEGVSGRTLYELLSRSTITDYDLYYYVDGVETKLSKDLLVRSNTDDVGATGNGVLTQVFVDHDANGGKGEIIITSINTWLARANNDYNTNSETVSLRVYNTETDGGKGDTQILDVAEIPNIVDIVKDQYVLVNMSGKDSGSADDLEVVKVSDVEILTDTTVTKFSTDDDGNTVGQESLFASLTADGEEYDAAAKALYNEEVLNLYDQSLLTDMSYNIYLDQYGYAIGVDLFEGSLNYVFITGYDRNSSNIAVRTATAAAIFLDGSMEDITVNVTNTNKNLDRNDDGHVDTDYAAKYDLWASGNSDGEPQVNRWFTYTESNGVYTLKPVLATQMLVTSYPFGTPATYTSQTINCSNVYVADDATAKRGYGNDDSVFITVEAGKVDTTDYDEAITDVTGVYTGVQDVDIIIEDDYATDVPNDVYTVVDDDQFIIASIVLGEAQGSVANYAYILKAPTSEEIRDGVYYWTFDAVMNGEKVTLTARSEYQDVFTVLKASVKQGIVELRFDGDYVTSAKSVPTDVNDTTDSITDGDEVYIVNSYIDSQRNTTTNQINLYREGRTLHSGNVSTGLTFASDAPTVLEQEVNGSWTTTEYDSFDDAYNDLADADGFSDGVLQFKGKIVAVLNSQGVAQWFYIYSETPVGAPTTPGNPSGMITTRPTVTMENNVIYVPVIDAASGSDRANYVTSAALSAMLNAGYTGYPNVGSSLSAATNVTTAGTFVAQDANRNVTIVTVQYQDFVTLTVDNRVEEYVRYNTPAYTTVGDIDGRGTGYLMTWTDSTPTNRTDYVTYATSSTSVGTLQYPTTITTGYGKVYDGSVTLTECSHTGGTVGAGIVGHVKETEGSEYYYDIDDGLKVEYVGPAAGSMGAHNLSLTIKVGGGDDIEMSGSIDAPTFDAGGAKYTFSINTSNIGKGDVIINGSTLVVSEPPAAATFSVGAITGTPSTPVNGLSISDVQLSKTTGYAGDVITVTFKVTGTATGSPTITMGGVTNAKGWVDSSALGGNIQSTSNLALSVTTGITYNSTISWQFTANGGAEAVTITVA